MQSRKYEQLAFIEGVVAGVYGNWLISLFDKMSFSVPEPSGIFQTVSFGVALSIFFYFILMSLVYTKPLTFKKGLLCCLIHEISLTFAVLAENAFFSLVTVTKDLIFILLGAILFIFMVSIDQARTHYLLRERHTM